MYTLLQCLTLLFLIAVDDAYFGTGWRRRYVPHVLLVLAGFVHQLGLLLAPLLFLPLIIKDSSFWTTAQRLRFTAVGVLTLLVCLMFERSVSALSSVADRYPSDYQAVHDSSLRAPAFPYWRLDGDPWTTLLVVVSLIAVVLAALWLLKRKGWPIAPVDIWICLLVILSAAHLLLLAGIVFLVLLLRHDLYRADRHPKRVYLLLAVAGLFAATWIVLTLTSPAILQSPEIGRRWDLAEAGRVKAIWTTLFGWPDLYAWTVRPFAVELPVLGLLTTGALIYNVFVHRHEPLPSPVAPALAGHCDDRARVRPVPGALLEFTLLVSPLPGDPLFDCAERCGHLHAPDPAGTPACWPERQLPGGVCLPWPVLADLRLQSSAHRADGY